MIEVQHRPTKMQGKMQIPQKPLYSVEFFHIYTDEKISPVHIRGMEYMKAISSVWNVNAQTVVLIDEYNPKQATLKPQDVFDFLETQGALPDYWAYEGALTDKAEELLSALTDRRLERSYRRYIEAHNKYPCSLLTATWYLTRLGAFDPKGVLQKCGAAEEYTAADRLINILPEGYKPVEAKAHELIAKSSFHAYADMIQDLFYEADYERELAVF